MLAVGAGGGCLDIFFSHLHLSFLSPSLWKTVRYRLKHCLKGPLSLKQPTNQQTNNPSIRPSPACLSVHPSISINCLKPLRTFSACPMTWRWWGSGQPALADARNGIKVKPEVILELEPHLCFGYESLPMGFSPINFASFFKYFPNPGHIVFGMCVRA